jgi:2-amino-4-hydroxy-6-hydroxymethyldihydropteridine diphosphokinase
MRALIGVGGNVGTEAELRERFHEAIYQLARRRFTGDMEASPLYRSAPVGPVAEQPPFLNLVVSIELAGPIEPVDLLAALLEIEGDLGRVREVEQGPRTIDLDLLAVDELVMADPGPPALVLPHPRLRERAFVVRPLADLVGQDWIIPGTGERLGDRLVDPDLASQAIEPLGPLSLPRRRR